MAGSKGRKSDSSKAYYGKYNYDAQRRARLTRHIKDHPNDEQAAEAAKAKTFSHRGPRPSGKKGGWVDRKMIPTEYDGKKGANSFERSPKELAFMLRVIRKANAANRVR